MYLYKHLSIFVYKSRVSCWPLKIIIENVDTNNLQRCNHECLRARLQDCKVGLLYKTAKKDYKDRRTVAPWQEPCM